MVSRYIYGYADRVIKFKFFSSLFRASQAAQAAAAAASQINAKLGITSQSPAGMDNGDGPSQMGGPPGMGPPMGMGGIATENFSVPDRMVGLSKC